MATIVTYKSRSYKQLWVGQTKHGRRAHLQFLDGSADFWVNADQVGAAGSSSNSSRSHRSRRAAERDYHAGSAVKTTDGRWLDYDDQ